MDTDSNQPQVDIPEDLYSRQLYAYGADAMKAMATSSVLFVGLQGLGVEISKNVVLSGVKSCTFYDEGLIELKDLGSQFFFSEEDIGKKRSEIALSKLAELNPLVSCNVITGTLTKEVLTGFTVVVCTNVSIEEQLRINEITHSHNVRFISSRTHGLFGQIFDDFGVDFEIFDNNGEQVISALCSHIADDGTITGIDEKRHGLETGDLVKFSEVQGLEALNGETAYEIKVLGPYSFTIGDISHLGGAYQSGGVFTQVKKKVKMNFDSLSKQLKNPQMVMSDFAKFDRPAQIHIGFLALDAFKKANGRYPKPYNKDDLGTFMPIAEAINKEQHNSVELSLDLMQTLCYQATGDCAPMQSVLGGFAAQEVMKATSGKFTPIEQFYYFDSLECLTDDLLNSLGEEQCAPIGSRYDGQIAIFGKNFQTKLGKLKTFIVGSGAIGCELIKNFSLMGVSNDESNGGETIVTDMDTIEKSNLNRQFLFRSWDVSNPKSVAASRAAKKINPCFNIIPYQDRVGEQTENVFDDEFFDSRDIVVNALDNVEARQYVDRRCVFYCKPLLESGTLGTKGNTQVVIPHLTESYSSTQDPPEKSIPICTLKNFPSAIEHTIQHARDSFEGLFTQEPGYIQQYIEQSNFIENLEKQPTNHQKETLESIIKNTKTNVPRNFQDCIKYARMQFQLYFHNNIAQLLHNFPKDMLTTTGTPFWAAPKRCPEPLVFDVTNPLHFDYIVAASYMRAFNYGIKSNNMSEIDLKNYVSGIVVEKFVAKSNVKIQVSDNEPIAEDEPDTEIIQRLLAEIPDRKTLKESLTIFPADFEKDDDSNYHIDYITCASNLRGTNYKIAVADRLKTKGIAGKIIPAVATTTSMIAGLSCLEFIKVVLDEKDIEKYKNSFVNLALPFTAFSEPIACPIATYNDKQFTLWDRIDVEGGMLVKDFVAKLEKEYEVEVQIISSGVSMLYACFMQGTKRKERFSSTIEQVILAATKKPIPEHVKSVILEVLVVDKNDEDTEFPFVRYHLKK